MIREDAAARLAMADFDRARQEMLAAFRVLDEVAQEEEIAATLSAMRQLRALQRGG